MSTYKLRNVCSALFGVLLACVLSLTMGIFSRAAYADTTDLVFPEPVKRGGIEITKTLTGGVTQVGDAKVEGIQFEIYLQKGNPVVVGDGTYYARETANTTGHTANSITTLTLDANGHAATANDLLPYGTYYVVEVENPAGSGMAAPGVKYNGDGKIVEVHDEKQLSKVAFENDTISGGISVYKYEPGVERPLAGAKFAIYNVGNSAITYTNNGNKTTVQPATDKTNPTGNTGKVAELVTGADGTASLGDNSLSTGKYMILEVEAPEGYQNTGFKETFTVGTQTSYHFDVPNAVNRGGVTIVKMDKERNAAVPQGDATLDSTYAIQYKGKATINVNGKEVASDGNTWITVYTVKASAANGIATTPDNLLPVGSYRIIETEAGYGYKLDSSWSYEFKIANNGQMVTIPADKANKNQVMRAGIKLVKLDMDTNQPVPQGSGKFDGIKFQLKVAEDCPNSVIIKGHEYQPGDVVTGIDNLLTMTNGVIETPKDLLPVGRYEISEVDVPVGTGYLRNDTWSDTFQVTPDEDGQFAKVTTADKWIWYELSDSTND